MDIKHAGFTQVQELVTASSSGAPEERLLERCAQIREGLEAWARSEGLTVSGECELSPEGRGKHRGIELELTYRRADGSAMSNRAFSGISDRLLERISEMAQKMRMRDRGYCLPLPLEQN